MASTSIPVLSDPTYGLPLIVTVASSVGVAWWALRRRFLPPHLVPYSTRKPWMERGDAQALLAAEQGRYRPAVEVLGRRLAQVLYDRFQLRLDDRQGLRRAQNVPVLASGRTLRMVVDDLFRAFRSAERVESADLGNTWPWLRRRRLESARRDFERITAEIDDALRSLEAV